MSALRFPFVLSEHGMRFMRIHMLFKYIMFIVYDIWFYTDFMIYRCFDIYRCRKILQITMHVNEGEVITRAVNGFVQMLCSKSGHCSDEIVVLTFDRHFFGSESQDCFGSGSILHFAECGSGKHTQDLLQVSEVEAQLGKLYLEAHFIGSIFPLGVGIAHI